MGIAASIPLFNGGKRLAEMNQAERDLERLRIERKKAAEMIEQRMRNALYKVATTHPSIELSTQAAEAARKNLELVTDAYSKGLVSIIELLDAQNFSINADQQAENAVFDFEIDLMEIDRAMGKFWFMRSAEEKEDWYRTAEEYMKNDNVK